MKTSEPLTQTAMISSNKFSEAERNGGRERELIAFVADIFPPEFVASRKAFDDQSREANDSSPILSRLVHYSALHGDHPVQSSAVGNEFQCLAAILFPTQFALCGNFNDANTKRNNSKRTNGRMSDASRRVRRKC